MVGTVLSDAQWKKRDPHGLGEGTAPAGGGTNTRLVVEAVSWKARGGSRWSDVPAACADWNPVFKRFDRWCEGAVFEPLLAAVSYDPDMEYALSEATLGPVHRPGDDAKGGLTIRPSAGQEAAGHPRSPP